ncbi:hypothetical protein D3C78_1806870 [compost metagenome]
MIQLSAILSPAAFAVFLALSTGFDFEASTTSWLSTETTPLVFSARRPARSLSAWLAALPVSITLPEWVVTLVVIPSACLLHSSFDLTAAVMVASSTMTP